MASACPQMSNRPLLSTSARHKLCAEESDMGIVGGTRDIKESWLSLRMGRMAWGDVELGERQKQWKSGIS